ncbi:4793_t:CDS:2 [Funneliformis caledonium]|uniref:Tubulin-specific chaperone A n=1 Tax=Funneliformis caledonium TaxID=1117310 RepID=A0A9N9BDD4_9GLOM|nr:4793_t:CDS:2 [Funneliformis caledonium]
MSVTLRELKIKTGVVKRLFKEEKSYRQEVEKQQKRIDKLTEDGTDKHTIAKQVYDIIILFFIEEIKSLLSLFCKIERSIARIIKYDSRLPESS